MEKDASDGASLTSGALTRIVQWLGGSLSLFKVVVLGIVFALCWALYHRGEVQLLPFEGPNGAADSLRLGRALDDVALGSTSDFDPDPSLKVAGDNGPPPIGIPGTGMSFASLVSFVQLGPLAQTRVHGALAGQEKAYQVWLQVFGPQVGERAIGTDAATDPDQALVQAAEYLYGVLKPIVRASYLYSRDPQRCLEVIREILSDPRSSGRDKAAAYRLWGLVLRDAQLDFEGARAKLNEAIEKTTSTAPQAQRSKARAWVDIGHTYLWEQRWHAAAAAYERSATLDDAWAEPHNFLGDALQGSGDVWRAIREYQEAIRRDPLYVEPWNGLGRAYMGQEQYENALDIYTTARHLHLRRDRTAAFTYYGLGDALFKLRCYDAAAEQYDRAVEIAPSFQEARYDWVLRRACQSPRPPAAGAAYYPWRPGPGPKAKGDALCIQTSASDRLNTTTGGLE
jgi:tetratricopeptide (TPR) repeat protein